jgi:ribosomal protein S18 acetylase RimI-like enzyme
MFNAAFISAPVFGGQEFAERLETARRYFLASGQQWSLWICEDWLDRAARKQASRLCQSYGLRLASDVPGMIAGEIDVPRRPMPVLEYRRVDSERALNDFAGIGTVCFNVPVPWYREVFDASLMEREFVSWIAYLDGIPVATAATVTAEGAIGIYNVATAPMLRGRGFGEAITRHVIGEARRHAPEAPVVLQASSMGVNLYAAMGFRAVTRIVVYNS